MLVYRTIKLQDETPVRSFMDLFGRKPAVVWHDSKLGETLSMFKAEKSHMAIVRDVEYPGEVRARPVVVCFELAITSVYTRILCCMCVYCMYI